MDEFKDIDSELMRLKEELNTKDGLLKQVKFPASGDYWRSRLDEERTLWEKKNSLHGEERKILEQKLNEQGDMLSRYTQSIKEIERKLENDAKLWEERLRLKEADILIEKNRLMCESRVREVEFDRQKLIEHAAELSSKITQLRDDQIIETEKLKNHSKQDAQVYEEKLKIAAAETRALQARMSDIDETFKARITELEKLKEEYRVRLESAEKKAHEEMQAKIALQNEISDAKTGHDAEKIHMRGHFEDTISRFGQNLNRTLGILSGFAKLAGTHNLKKSSFSAFKDLADKAQSESEGIKKELALKFKIDDDFRVSLYMGEDDAAYWEAALSGTKIEIKKITLKENPIKKIIMQKPRVCVVSSKKLKTARVVKSKWPFIPVLIYGDLAAKQAEALSKNGIMAVSHYNTADDMILTLCDTAKESPAVPEYWDKIKIKYSIAAPIATAAVIMLVIAAGLFVKNNPVFMERFSKVAVYNVPYSQPSNITFDGQYLWGCDWFGQSIYKHDASQSLKLMRIFCFPGKHFTAITWAGGYLWSADAWENTICKHNIDDTLSVVEKYSTPGTSISGLAFDGKNIWSCDSSAGMIYRHTLDENLTVEDAFESPGASPSGLFFDGTTLWSTDSKINKIFRHRMDANLSVEASYIPPLYDQKNYNLSGIAIKGSRVWVCSEKLGKVFSFAKSKMELVK